MQLRFSKVDMICLAFLFYIEEVDILMQKQNYKLTEEVWSVRLVPYYVKGKVEQLLIDWLSCWGNGMIELCVNAIRTKNGRWRIIELDMPIDIPKEDAEDIIDCKWFVVDKKSNRKCPPIMQLWGFDRPPVYVIACMPSDNYQLLKHQLKDMEESNQQYINATDNDFISTLRSLGPAICTVSSSVGLLQFDINEKGILSERSYCPVCKGNAGSEMENEILGALTMHLSYGPAGVTVRTFTNKTVCIKGENGNIKRVPVKELRGFIAAYEWGDDGSLQIIWKKLPPEEMEKMYGISSSTGQHIDLAVDKRDHRFV
jgi:hypothetical protein